MSYKKLTIKQIISDIDQSKVYLPALQRKFVWNKNQIELLFDSLMRNFPFGTFLFWNLNSKNAENYVFYKFLTNYDERTPFNEKKTGAFTQKEIIGVLDGQQRLSSMYVGLMGTHTEKMKYRRVGRDNAYLRTSLYVNLLSLPYTINRENNYIDTNENQNFEFRFLNSEWIINNPNRPTSTENESPSSEATYWMKVGDVLSWGEEPEFDEIFRAYQEKCEPGAQRVSFDENARKIRRFLNIFHRRIQIDELINYYQIDKEDLEDILKIFVRVNSGGTILSKTDLLFSTIVATWDDGREKIEGLLKNINGKGDGFNFGSEYLMRCCLVLTDGPVLYKVNSFRQANVLKIQNEWDQISKAIEKTVDLLVEFGFCGNLLTSQNSTIIISYYLYKNGNFDEGSKSDIKKYLIHALLNGVYGSSQEQLINSLRTAFRKEEIDNDGNIKYVGVYSNFSFDEMLKIKLPLQKSLLVSEVDLDRYLSYTKGAASFFVLSLLYPNLRFSEIAFHQDHIHPASSFSDTNFEILKISKEERLDWISLRDCVPNLQLMEGRQNIIKNATPIANWLDQKDEADKTAFLNSNYFPPNASLDLSEFMNFFNQRKDILRDRLKNVLKMSSFHETTETPEAGCEDISQNYGEPFMDDEYTE